MNKFKEFLSSLGKWFVKVGKKIGLWFKSLFVSVDSKEPKLKTLIKKESSKSVFASLISILGGLAVGIVIMLIVGIAAGNLSDIWRGIVVMISGPFFTGSSYEISFGFNQASIGNMLFRTTPILMTGLSVALAFKTGLFNIGASGQFLMGTMGSLLVALKVPATAETGGLVWLLALLTGIALGMLWGIIPGLFKALLNINEVITCIMTNWIAANVVSWVFSAQTSLQNSPEGKTGYIFPTRYNNVANPRLGFDKLFAGSWADGGIIIAVIFAIIIFIVLNRTVFGFELRATGGNRNAARYAGMNEKRNIILSMALAGGLAACGASLYYLNGNTEFFWETSMTLPSEGFNGIPVALLACNNPIGVIFSSMLMAFLDISGSNLSGVTSFNEHIADLIVGVIIYFSGFSMFIRSLISTKRAKETNHLSGGATPQISEKQAQIPISEVSTQDLSQPTNEKGEK